MVEVLVGGVFVAVAWLLLFVVVYAIIRIVSG